MTHERQISTAVAEDQFADASGAKEVETAQKETVPANVAPSTKGKAEAEATTAEVNHEESQHTAPPAKVEKEPSWLVASVR